MSMFMLFGSIILALYGIFTIICCHREVKKYIIIAYHKIEELCKKYNFHPIYKIERIIDDIKDFFNNYPNRHRMKKMFNKFYSFEICQDIPDVMFGMFEEFYKYGDLDFVDWTWNDEHIQARKVMDNIFTYTQNRKKWRTKIDYILSKSTIDIVWTDDPENEGFRNLNFTHIDEKKDQKISDLYNRTEERLSRLDEKWMIEMIKIRNFLWI